jgi:hypothetical protein
MNLYAAYHATAPAMVDASATVLSAGPIDVIDNVDLAPRIPVQPGDRIEVCGEMVHDPGKLPIVHWTHHDPANRHPGGFIRFRGRLYA